MGIKKRVARVAELPLLALRGLVVFPGMLLHFDVGRKKSILALNEAMSGDQTIFLVSQTDIAVDDPRPEHLYDVGVVAKVRQVLKMPGDTLRVMVEGGLPGQGPGVHGRRALLSRPGTRMPGTADRGSSAGTGFAAGMPYIFRAVRRTGRQGPFRRAHRWLRPPRRDISRISLRPIPLCRQKKSSGSSALSRLKNGWGSC